MGIIRVYNFHHLAYRFALRNQIFSTSTERPLSLLIIFIKFKLKRFCNLHFVTSFMNLISSSMADKSSP